MKTILLTFCIFLLGANANSQSVDSTQVGKIVYYEGKVELGKDPNWVRAKINMAVKRNQFIRIPGDGMAEIAWNGGAKSTIGPNSYLLISSLANGSSGKSKAETEGIFNDFKNIFSTAAETKRSEEGGIRRTQVVAEVKQDPNEVYWKQDVEISFEEAFNLYESQDYSKSISALQAYVYQKPDDPMTPYAVFALGHSYIMANNPVKAKEIYQDFMVKYPTSPLKEQAEKVLEKLL